MPTNHEREVVARLERLVTEEDRGALAALRRGLGKPPGSVLEMYPVVIPWLPPGSPPRNDDACFVVAALFAYWHQGKSGLARKTPIDLGASMRLRGFVDGRWNEDRFKSVERRFAALLNCHRDDLHVHLRHAVALLKSADIPVDWAQLLADIRCWNCTRRPVQRAWAKTFWAPPHEESPGAAEAANPE